MVTHYYPGVVAGHLTLGEFFDHCGQIGRIEKWKRGEDSNKPMSVAETVEAMLRGDIKPGATTYTPPKNTKQWFDRVWAFSHPVIKTKSKAQAAPSLTPEQLDFCRRFGISPELLKGGYKRTEKAPTPAPVQPAPVPMAVVPPPAPEPVVSARRELRRNPHKHQGKIPLPQR